MENTFKNEKFYNYIMHDESELTGKLMFLKKHNSIENNTPTFYVSKELIEGKKVSKFKVNGKKQFKIYSSDLKNQSIGADLKDFLKTYKNLENDDKINGKNIQPDYIFKIYTDKNILSKSQINQYKRKVDKAIEDLKNKYSQDDEMIKKLSKSVVLSIHNENVKKTNNKKAFLRCLDLEMNTDFTHVQFENKDPKKISDYKKKYGYETLENESDYIFNFDDYEEEGKLQEILEHFFLNLRSKFSKKNIMSQKKKEFSRFSKKITLDTFSEEYMTDRNKKDLIIFFYNGNKPDEIDLLKRFEKMSYENIVSSKHSKVKFLRLNTAKNTFKIIGEAESPSLRIIRQGIPHFNTIDFNKDNFESVIKNSTNVYSSREPLGLKDFLKEEILQTQWIENLIMKPV